MAWSATPLATVITESVEYVQRIFWPISGYVSKRSVTRTTTEYRGLTDAGATTQRGTSAAVAGCVNAVKVRVDDSGQYKVVEEKETYGAWEYDSTFTEVAPTTSTTAA